MRRLERVQLCPGAVDSCREDWKRFREISERPAGLTQPVLSALLLTVSGSGESPSCKCGYNYIKDMTGKLLKPLRCPKGVCEEVLFY